MDNAFISHEYCFMKNHFIKIFLLILILPIGHLAGQNQIGLPLIKNYSSDEYKGGIQNWQIAQDKEGIIYVANNLGLLQYDGSQWRMHEIPDASKVRSLAISTDNRIYIGCQGDIGYFKANSVGTLKYHSLKALIPEPYKNIGEAWKTYLLNDKIFFCTFKNIYVYDFEKIYVIEGPNALDISYLAGNSIYTHVYGSGIQKVEGKGFVPQPFSEQLSDKTISGVLTSSLDELLITTQRFGIYKTLHNELKLWKKELNELFSSTFINCAILLSNGNIAIGTQHDGVYILNGEGDVQLHLSKDRGLHSRTILGLYEDTNGNLWIGQNNGISFVEIKSPFRKINEEVGLPGTGYAALSENENLYLGTNNGVYRYDGTSLNLIHGSEGQVYNLQVIKKHLLVSHNNGALTIKDDTAEVLDGEIGTWMFLDLSSSLLQGTYNGIKVLNPDNFSEIGMIKGLNESSRIIVEQNDSTVWMSHGYKGLYRLGISKKTPLEPIIMFYNEDSGLPSDRFNEVHSIEGQLKITMENGIYEYNAVSNQFDFDPVLNPHFLNERITVLKNDIYGNIYFITNSSIGFLEKLGHNQYEKHTAPFNAIRNLLNDDLVNINPISPNVVLFGGKEGFISFDRNLFWTTEGEKFNTIIRRVTYNGNETGLLYDGNSPSIDSNTSNEMPQVDFQNNTVSFHFSATSFSSTTSPEFQYRLIGFDKSWQDWTESNFKEYTNLKEGAYKFEIKSRNANNIESPVESYEFSIRYPWYRSPLAYILYVLAGVALFVSVIFVLDKKHQLEKEQLDSKRKKELSEKDKQLDTVTKTSEDKISKLKNEKLMSEIRHMNTELATNTMHLLNKNEFINGIKSHSWWCCQEKQKYRNKKPNQ